ncbi:MAG: HAMP domain-containing histidine kinase [Rubrivivax sp.]|nr:HAMP domain-containing histidine kinase [Rubrivivax sp.]
MRGRFSIAAHLTLFVALGLGLAAMLVHFADQHHEAQLVESIADTQLAATVAQLRDADVAQAPRALFVPLFGRPEMALPARYQALEPGRHVIGDRYQFEQVLVSDVGPTRVVVSYGDAAHQTRLRDARRTGLLIVIGCIALMALAARPWARALLGARPALQRRLAAADGLARGAATDLIGRLAQAYGSPPPAPSAPPVILDREREFIANVGHELRTPITMITTGCELLLDGGALGERERAALRRMAGAAEHMKESVQSFMILARDGHLGSSETVSLRDCVLEAVAPHRGALMDSAIALHVSVAPDVGVMANREALYVVVNNLVKNAVKYTDRGSISVRHIADTLYVADTGCGIADGELPNVFLPFYRSRWAADSGREGLGLGLAIVKRVCDHYGWIIDVRSSEGQGTTVTVDFASGKTLFG